MLLSVVQSLVGRLELGGLMIKLGLFFLQLFCELFLGLLVRALGLGQGRGLVVLRCLKLIVQLVLDALDVASGLLELGLNLSLLLVLKFLLDVHTLSVQLGFELLLGLSLQLCLLVLHLLLHLSLCSNELLLTSSLLLLDRHGLFS